MKPEAHGAKADVQSPGCPVTGRACQGVITREELAVILKVCVRTVDTMMAAGEIPHLRIRGNVRFYLPDVVKALAANALTSKRRCARSLPGSEVRR